MSRPVRAEFLLPCDVAAAFAVVSGEGWAAARADALEDCCQVVSRETTASGGLLVVVSRELPDGVPGFLQRFLPADPRVVQTETWEPAGADGSRRGTWSARLPGAPGTAEGSMVLEPADGGCRERVEGAVKVPVPLVGGKAESYLAEQLERLLAAEAEVLRGLVT